MRTNLLFGAILLLLATAQHSWAQQDFTTTKVQEPLVLPSKAPVSPLREVLLEKLKSKEKVTLELFVMSQCPFGVQAEQALMPIVQELGERLEFKLYFVGWYNSNQVIESMHGQAEVAENHRQAVIAKLYPTLLDDYLLARAKNYHTNEWKSIAQAVGVSPELVEKTMDSQEGKQLLVEAVRPSIERKVYASPTVFIDNEKYQGRILAPRPNGIVANANCSAEPSGPVMPQKEAKQTENTLNTAATPDPQCSGQSNNTPCNDGNACTQNDACQNEACVGTNLICNDNNPCTVDTCIPTTGQCVFTPKNCNDNNACTTDACNRDTGACINIPKVCNDNNPCTIDSCNPVTGECIFTDVISDDNNACTVDSCNPLTGQVIHAPVNCDDGNACTIDSCDPVKGCINTPYSAQQLDDNNACTRDFCDQSRGIVHEPIVCNDNNPNTIDSCNPAQGCVSIPSCQVTYPDNIAYVNAAARGSNLGNSWANAFTDLQNALFAARNCGVTQIWVARGTYKPTPGTDRSISFSMVNGVSILGGFPNDGTGTLANRNWATNPTILSGDLNGDDTFTGTGTNLSIGNNSDNSYIIIRNGNTLDNTARLDGFIVSGANNTISTSFGGGVFNDGRNGTCNPVFANCIFRHSLASRGGAVANHGDNGTCNPSFTHCLFYQNQAINNDAGSYGGAMYCVGNVTTVLSHCTFSQNKTLGRGGAITAVIDAGSPNVILRNCILWGNAADQGGNQVFIAAATLNLHHTLLQGGTGAIGTFFTNTINDNGGLLDANPLFVNANGGNYRLQACSPAINAGDPATTSATVGNVDLANNPRFFNGGTVDMGAYEYQGTAGTQLSATVSSNSPLCVGGTLRLSVTGAGAGATYSWGATSPFGSTLQNPTRANATVAMSGIYSVTVSSGCSSAVLTTSVVVSPNVAPSITSLRVNGNLPNAQTNTVAACTNAPVNLNITATNAVTYSWRGPTGAGSGFTSSLVSPVTMPIASPRQGQYTVTVRNGCQVFNQRVINIQLINCSNTRLASAEDAEAIDMEINAYPNPLSKTLTVEVRLREPSAVRLNLVNSVGQGRGTWRLDEVTDFHRTELNLADLQGGVYLLEATAGKQRAVKRVVKIQYE